MANLFPASCSLCAALSFSAAVVAEPPADPAPEVAPATAPEVIVDQAADIAEVFRADELQTAAKIRSGFTLGSAVRKDVTNIGDTVLLGVVMERGQQRTVRFMMLTVIKFMDGFSLGTVRFAGKTSDAQPVSVVSDTVPVLMAVFDETGAEQSVSLAGFAAVCAGRGGYEYQEWILDRKDRGFSEQDFDREFAGLSPEERLEFAKGQLWMLAMAPSLSENKSMAGLMAGIAEKPSLLGLLTGVQATVSPDRPARAGSRRLGDHILPASSMPMTLRLNSTRSLAGTLTAVPAVDPLYLCGGLVALDAQNPAHPDRRIRVRLLGAGRAVVEAGEAQPKAP